MKHLLSIKVLLQGVTGLMALMLVAVFATSAWHAYARRETADHVLAVVSISRDLFMAMQTIRVERGAANTGLETDAPLDDATKENIVALRLRSNAALDSALAKIAMLDDPAIAGGLKHILLSRADFDTLRTTVDAALTGPKYERPADLGKNWVAAGGRLVDGIDDLSQTLSNEIAVADPFITEMMKVKQFAWIARDAAGLDRLLVGATIANNQGASIERRLQLSALTGRIEAAWQVFAKPAGTVELPPALKASIATAQALYFDNLRPLRQALLDGINAGKTAAISGADWVNLSNPALEALVNIANTAFDLSTDKAAEQTVAANRTLISAVLLTVFFSGLGVFIILFVRQYIARPMGQITDAMRAVARGELDRPIPDMDRGDEIGDLARALGVFRDNSREKQRMAGELLRQERLSTLGQVTATVAHELRNPLSAVRNSLFTIKEALGSGDGHQLARPIARIERSISRCNDIITSLMDFTQSSQLRPRLVDADRWLDQTLKQMPIPKDIALRCALDGGAVRISIDSERIGRALTNVVENAVHALAEREGERAITVTTRAAANGYEVTIDDTGPGIPVDVMPRVFEPLFSTKSFGTGLGLPTVKQIVEQHGGAVAIVNLATRGLRVAIQLPAAMPSEIAA